MICYVCTFCDLTGNCSWRRFVITTKLGLAVSISGYRCMTCYVCTFCDLTGNCWHALYWVCRVGMPNLFLWISTEIICTLLYFCLA
uniref:Uncharacterized protein n=1 Tax=Picea sitchensis TaxID=3332 RepID=D5A8F7_PICSI|nr:unknown [Picea sitchensis]